MGFDHVDKKFQPKEVKLECIACQSTQGVELENSRTQYPWDGKGEDPNRPVPLCRLCAKDHHKHWDELWDEYRAGLL